MSSLVVPMILTSILLAVAGQLLLKGAMNRVGRVDRSSEKSNWKAGIPHLIAGLGLYGVSTVFWLMALAHAELSFAFPFLSLSYVATILSARFVFGEELNGSRLLGSGLIITGVLVVSFSA